MPKPKSYIITPTDAARLESLGHATPHQGGYRGIQAGYVRCGDYVSPETKEFNMEQIPAIFESPETLMYLGFTEAAAQRMFRLWDEDDLCWNFEGIAKDEILESRHARCSGGDDDEWRRSLAGMSIDDKTIEAIMAPEFTDVRQTEPAGHWALDTLEMRLDTLLTAQASSRDRDAAAERAQTALHLSTIDQSLRAGAAGEWGDVTWNLHSPLPEHTLLWKGVSEFRTKQLRSTMDHGKLNFSLFTTFQSDFHACHAALCLATDEAVAQKHAAYCKRRCASGRVLLMTFIVPNQLIEDLQPVVLAGETWQKLVWASRAPSRAPPDIRQLAELRRKPLLIGPIAPPRQALHRIQWPELTTDQALTVDGEAGMRRKAIQYVFVMDQDVYDKLEDPESGFAMEMRLLSSQTEELSE